ncbi:MAG: zinc-ribbon domain-containing protein, partial [Candidatus Binataceae bacterium]
CSNCGAMIPPRTHFCAQCGTTAAHATTTRATNPLVGALVTGVVAATSLAVTIFQNRFK